MKPTFSFIIPVYNRPNEIDELLESLSKQTFKNFEVLIIEDGSELKCEVISKKYESKLNILYYFKENTGQGFSRNYGFERANSNYFIQLDSDAIVPEKYLEIVDYQINKRKLDAFGGPDKAHESFTDIQKAINYSMTSFFTTGGIRGKAKNAGGQFHPRSFNFGISRAVYEKTKGYKWTRKAEDIEFSIRILEAGFKVELIEEAFIFHKRRTSFSQFFKQLEFFGRGRINLSKYFPKELKIVHFFPLCFLISILSIPLLYLLNQTICLIIIICFLIYFSAIIFDSYKENKSIKVAFLSVFACIIQLSAYGLGFIKEKIGL